MNKDDKKIAQMRKMLDDIEEKVQQVKRILFEQVYEDQAENMRLETEGPSTIIEGVFDGQEMIDKTGKKYSVPENYASKSKLVPGDNLKLTIAADGTFIFKQIGPVDRKRIIGELVKRGDEWQVLAEGKKYSVLQAAVTYFKASPGDTLTIIIPKTGESAWAAIENFLNHGE